MNPFDLHGPDFLKLYAVLAAAAWTTAWWFRRSLLEAPAAEESPAELTAMEAACLQPDQRQAAAAAVAALIHAGALEFRKPLYFVPHGATLPADADAVAAAVYQAAHGKLRGVRREALRKAADHALAPVHRRLVDLGLRPARSAAWWSQGAACLLLLGVAAFGFAKIYHGLERGRPVAFLALAAVATVLSTNWFLRPAPATRRGRAALAAMQGSHAALRTCAATRLPQLRPADVALAAGLFGLATFAGADAPLGQYVEQAKATSGGCGMGCGSGGCGCGGGCGGCGG